MSRLQTPVRKNDNVVVVAGKDRGKRGRVLRVVPDKNRVVVEGVNFIKKHTRPNPKANVKGGIVEREAALHASNVEHRRALGASCWLTVEKFVSVGNVTELLINESLG